MRLLATELGVRAPALYWHVKNKQELLDAMATIVFVDALADVEAPGRDTTWSDWLTGVARRMRMAMRSHRDGARVLAGSYVAHPAISRTIELSLRTLRDFGFAPGDAARSTAVVLHYTVGFTIEEQARAGTSYEGDNPYAQATLEQFVDAGRFPLTAEVTDVLFDVDSDAAFEDGLRTVLEGVRARQALA